MRTVTVRPRSAAVMACRGREYSLVRRARHAVVLEADYTQ